MSNKFVYDYKFLKNKTERTLDLSPVSHKSTSLDHSILKKQIKLYRFPFPSRIDAKLRKFEYPPVSTRPVPPKAEKFILKPLRDLNISFPPPISIQKKTFLDLPEEFSPLPPIKNVEDHNEYQLKLPEAFLLKLKKARKSKITFHGQMDSIDEQRASKLMKGKPELSTSPKIRMRRQTRMQYIEEFYRNLTPLKETIEKKQKINRSDKQQKMNTLIQIMQNKVKNQDMLINTSKVILQEQSSDETRSLSTPAMHQIVFPQKMSRFKRIRISLILFLNKLKKLHLTPRQIMNNKIFSKYPHEKENSNEFFQAIKSDDYKQVQELIKKTPYLVYDYDNALMTGLHWAAKRGKLAISKLLLINNSDVDALDLVQRTPLYLATDFEHIEIVQLLLYKQADPWSNEFNSYREIIKNPILKQLFTTSRWIHICLAITPPGQRHNIWSKEAPAMSAVRNFIPNNLVKQKEINELISSYSHLEPRLQFHYNLIIQHQLRKRKDDKTIYGEMEKKIQRDLKLFELVTQQQKQKLKLSIQK